MIAWLFNFIIVLCVIFYLSYPPQTGLTLMFSRAIIFLIGFIAVVSLLIKSIKFVWLHSLLRERSWFSFLSRALIIFAAICGFSYLSYVNNQAVSYFWEQAEAINTQCNKDKKCPVHPAGWSKHDFRYRYDYVYFSTKFYLFYSAEDDVFSIYINYGPDFSYKLVGGVNKVVSQ